MYHQCFRKMHFRNKLITVFNNTLLGFFFSFFGLWFCFFKQFQTCLLSRRSPWKIWQDAYLQLAALQKPEKKGQHYTWTTLNNRTR